jgi:hypothetical protein
MEHWFDSATKILARQGASRPEALKGLALTPIASLISRQARAQVTPGGPGPTRLLLLWLHALEPMSVANALP